MSVRFQSLSTSATGTWSAMLKVRSKSEKRSPPSTASEPTAAPATTRSSSSASRSRRSRRASRCSTVNTMRDPTSAVSRTAPADLGRGHRDTPSEDSTSRGIRQTVPRREEAMTQEQELFAVEHVDHVEVLVRDQYQAAAWYRQILGLQILPQYEDWAPAGGALMISSDGGRTMLALFVGEPQGRHRVVGLRRV